VNTTVTFAFRKTQGVPVWLSKDYFHNKISIPCP